MPQDEAAVVGGGQVARPRSGGVGAREDAEPERLGRLAAPVAAPLGDLDDLVVLDDHEGVRARDDRVGPVRAARQDRLDRALDHVERHQRPDRVVDDHHVVIGPVEGGQPVAGALVAGRAAGDHDHRHLERRRLHELARLVDPARVRHDHDPVHGGRAEGPKRAQEDRVAGESDELLRHLATEPVAVTAGEDDRVDLHTERLRQRRHRRPRRYHRYPAWSRSPSSAGPPPASRTSS